MFDSLTRQAISHTLHCLAGCAIGEVMGMVFGTYLLLNNLLTTFLAIVLAFFFGYLFTIISLRRKGVNAREGVKIAIATDTTSIASMEIIDNAFIWLIPGAIDATLSNSLFWISLISSLVVAFILTVPVNRWFISRRKDHFH